MSHYDEPDSRPRRASISKSPGRLTSDDLFGPSMRPRPLFYILLILAVGGFAANIIADITAMRNQERNAATIRQLGKTGLQKVEIFSGGEAGSKVHCVTIDDRATLEQIAEIFSHARAGIDPERTIPVYAFTFVVTDATSQTVNLQGSTRTKWQQDAFIDFMYTGPLQETLPVPWQFPVTLPGSYVMDPGCFRREPLPAARARCQRLGRLNEANFATGTGKALLKSG